MKDKILEQFFKTERWENALAKSIDKKMDIHMLRELKKPENLNKWMLEMVSGEYHLSPPRQVAIPKDDGTSRIIYVYSEKDRIFLSLVTEVISELMGKRYIHKNAVAYQKGIGCSLIVKHLPSKMKSVSKELQTKDIGFKADLSKYFDTVCIEEIDKSFDNIQAITGKSILLDILKECYHSNLCYNLGGQLVEIYQGLKQGCAFASYLANTVLYDVDIKMSSLKGQYLRYSDDILYIGTDHKIAQELLKTELKSLELKLNPKKVETIYIDQWFQFLGFSIKGKMISFSKNRLKNLISAIKHVTLNVKTTPKQAINAVNRILYIGDGQYARCDQLLGVINCKNDILLLDNYIKDCIRSTYTNHKHCGGVGYEPKEGGCLVRDQKGNVSYNREHTPKILPGYYSLVCMRKIILTAKPLYNTIINSMIKPGRKELLRSNQIEIDLESATNEEVVAEIERLYDIYYHTLPTPGDSVFKRSYLHAQTQEDYDNGGEYNLENRSVIGRKLEGTIKKALELNKIPFVGWYWHSETYKDLIILKDWK